jgi:glycosyltransferase involved in cell wall biosynthesis
MRLLIESMSLFPPRTGIGRSTTQLVEFLLQRKEIHKIQLIFMVFPLSSSWKQCKSIAKQFSPTISVKRIPLPMGWLLRGWNNWKQPTIDFFSRRFDLIHGPAHVLPPTNHIGSILTIHDTTLIEHPEWYPQQTQCFRTQIIQGITNADAIIVPSQAVKDKLLTLQDERNQSIYVLPHEINYINQSCNRRKSEIQHEIFGYDCPYLLWVGEINPRKNLLFLFSVLKELKQKYPDLTLVLAGSYGYQSQAILNKIKDFGLHLEIWNGSTKAQNTDVLFMERLPEKQLTTLYCGAELFLFPSLDEGFGFPIVEAMARGIPVICSNSGALPEIGGNAVIASDLNQGPVHFVNAIHHLLENPDAYEKQKRLGFQQIDRYKRENTLEPILSIYHSVIQSKSNEWNDA